MLESLRLIYQRLIEKTRLDFYRYLYFHFNTNDRLTGLTGARGVGKTTLLLQYIKNNFTNLNEAFYVSVDHIYFEQITLYQFVENLYLTEGTCYFFLDEVHKYKNWDQELKNLYDGFPDITIVFSGSSSLDLTRGSYDLSRRARMYELSGMSLREYINFTTHSNYKPIPFQHLLKDCKEADVILPSIPKLKGHFQEYLRSGFYPYDQNRIIYYQKLLQTVDKTIYEDIANFYNFKTNNLHHLRKILNFLVTIPPGKISLNNLAKNLEIDNKTAITYLHALQETGLVNLVYPDAIGNPMLRRPEKALLSNTNLHFALLGKLYTEVEIGTVRELYFVQALKNADIELFYSDKGDYRVADMIFEIGGKNKTRHQIKGEKNALIIKDDIYLSEKGVIPLLYLGFLY